MKTTILAVAILSVAALAAPSRATGGDRVSGQVPEANSSVVAAADPAELVQVTGAVATLADDRIEVKVERVAADAPEVTAAMVGKTVAFRLNPTTEKPNELKAGDRVDLWFKEGDNDRLAIRIVVAQAGGDASGSAAGSAAPAVPPSQSAAPSSPEVGESSGAAAAPSQPVAPSSPVVSGSSDATAAPGDPADLNPTADRPAAPLAAPAAPVPDVGSLWSLAGLIGLAALVAFVFLRLTLHTGKAHASISLSQGGQRR
jgi:hypothetical protein